MDPGDSSDLLGYYSMDLDFRNTDWSCHSMGLNYHSTDLRCRSMGQCCRSMGPRCRSMGPRWHNMDRCFRSKDMRSSRPAP